MGSKVPKLPTLESMMEKFPSTVCLQDRKKGAKNVKGGSKMQRWKQKKGMICERICENMPWAKCQDFLLSRQKQNMKLLKKVIGF